MIYIGVPVHDERHTIGPLLWSIRKVLLEHGGDFQLLVVDDASTDGTDAALEPYRRVLPLTVVRHERRRGYAASLERLIREALERSGYHRRDALLTLQADFTDDPEAIGDMLRKFQSGADLVLGVPRPERPPRLVRFGRTGAALLSRSLPRAGEVEDPLAGFRLCRLFVLERALEDVAERGGGSGAAGPMLRHQGWAANAELLARILPHVRRVEEVEFPQSYTRRYRESRFRPVSELWGVLRLGLDRDLRRGPRDADGDEGAAPAEERSG